MFSKKLYYTLIRKVLLLCIVAMLFSYSTTQLNIEASVFLGVILLFLIIHFIFYLNKTNKKIAYFFNAIKNNDSTLYFSESTSKTPTKELNAHLNNVNEVIQKIKLKNKAQDQYYKTIIENAEIGVLTINTQNHILFANQNIKNILNYNSLTHINQLKKIDENLFHLIQELQPFSNKIIELTNERETKLLTLNATQIKLNNEVILLVVASNIKNELDHKEVDSWVKLTKVLTHEIMNSIAPISSITETIHDSLKGNLENIDTETLKSTLEGIEVIKEQTKSLHDFVVSYRSFSGVSHPEKQVIEVPNLLLKMYAFFETEIKEKKIDFKINCQEKNLQIFADQNQVVQILFNLIKNAVESLQNTDQKKITLTAFSKIKNQVIISVEDNGNGIPNELITQIFVPFYSTKEDGSGVGLSLSKHIMKMHNGTLTAHSIPNKKTTFTLTF